MNFSHWLFLLAGIYGIVVLLPLYFMERKVGNDNPPAITHPEYYYGMIGVGLAWQVAFLIIAQDPARFRPLMIPSAMEKFCFAAAVIVLFLQGRVPGMIVVAGMADLTLGLLFLVAWWQIGMTPG